MIRNSYYLDDREWDKLNRLDDEEGQAWEFWGGVAHSRGLDYKTLIGDVNNNRLFSAMPYGHGKDWCHPIPLKNTRRAKWNGKDVYFEN